MGCCFEGISGVGGDQRGQTNYFGGIYDDLGDFVNLWRQEARACGVKNGGKVVVLSDGAPWIWNQVAEEFPEAVQILDFYHAVEHAGEVARVVFGEGSEAGKKWVEEVAQRLKKGELDLVIKQLEGIKSKGRRVQQVIKQTVSYYQNNAHRMEYAHYLEKGYFIGSGVIESSCRHLSNQRLKIAGARWDKDNANAILSIRIARANKTWDNYWEGFRKSG